MAVSLVNISISVLVVSIFLVVYRQLDRNNRSLEKVKRYSDLVRGNLSEFVEEKTSEIKDLAIELQVNLKTGTEILNRIKSTENELREKAVDVEELRKKVVTYDTVIKDLAGMTSRVEENLKRIHSESNFVDALGKKIRESVAKIGQIEKRIPEVLAELKQDNEARLQRLGTNLKTGLENRLATLKQGVDTAEQRVEDFSTYITRLEVRRDGLESRTVENLEKISRTVIVKTKETRGKMVSELNAQIKALLDQTDERKTRWASEVASLLDKSEAHLKQLEDGHIHRLNDYDADLAKIESNYKQRLENAAQRGQTLEHEAFLQIKERIERNSKKLTEEIASKGKSLEDDLETGQKDIVEIFGKARSEMTVWQARVTQSINESEDKLECQRADMSERMGILDDELSGFRKDADSRMEHASGELDVMKERLYAEVEDIESRVVVSVEKRLEDYEGDAVYRINKLEQANIDIVALEANLRQVMERISGNIRSDFDEFARLLEERRNNERQRTDDVIDSLHGEMVELEKGLAELKTKAYQDVSDKLKGFEDDFLGDLSERSQGLEESLKTWQEGVSNKLAEIAETQTVEREQIEDNYREGLASGLGNMEELYSKEIERVHSELKQRIGRLGEDLDLGRQGLMHQLNLAEAEALRWKERLEQEMNQSKTIFNDRFGAFSEGASSSIATLKSDFDEQRDELIIKTREERTALKSELKELSTRVTSLQKHLNEKTASVFELFKKRQDEFELEFKLKSQDLRSEITEQVRAFRSAASDIKEKSTALKDKLFGKVEESYKWLSGRLSNMERQQKDFVSQTKLFDRADKLKLDLERNIGELRKNLTILEPQRKDMRVLEGEFKSTRMLVDDVNSKLGRFHAERRRIDDLEKNFTRLLELSQSVDVKLAAVTANHDALEALQIKLRDLGELENEISTRYERLEKKRDIVDLTTDGVEKNFEYLDNLEKEIKTLAGELKRLPAQVTELNATMGALAQNKEKADSAVEQVNLLDNYLEDVEERMNKLQTAREWLAKTETRLISLDTKAQEHVKLLQALSKSDADHTRAVGAPGTDKRETVLKLAGLGWSSREISQRTNISRGEVELILELAPGRK